MAAMPDSARAIAAAFIAVAAFMLGGAIAETGAPLPLAVAGAVAMTVGAMYVLYHPSELRVERRAKGLCPSCGYDLTGNVSGVCPECGSVR